MDLKIEVTGEINRIIARVKAKQTSNGSWHYCFESGPMTDASMIILLRTLEFPEEELIRHLSDRIASLQEQTGEWRLFHDEEQGNLSASIEAYYALLFSGDHHKNDQHMQAAKRYILSRGGLKKANLYTKVILATTGQIPWPRHISIPVEIMMLPTASPIHFFDFVGFARVHIAPVLLLADRKFSIKSKYTADLSDLLIDPARSSREQLNHSQHYEQNRPKLNAVQKWIQELSKHSKEIHASSIYQLERFLLERVEVNGTLYSYASSTFLFVLALLSLGYAKSDPVILRAIQGLKTLIWKTDRYIHLQNSPSTVWDTALLSYALQEAGVSVQHPMIQKAVYYLLSRQHVRYGDWAIKNQNTLPGGWGFSDVNTFIPDIDDTTAALRALSRTVVNDQRVLSAWQRGLNWVLSMQNDDGGWAAFEKNTHKRILTWLPMDSSKEVLIDPSSADLTGRTLEFLGNYAGFTLEHENILKGVFWLINHQESNGSWRGIWGISYIYGTWAAVTGMMAVGVAKDHPVIQKAVGWILSIQNPDGGWGESCKSDIQKKYIPLGYSTPSQTAWALDALVAVLDEEIPAITKGVQFLNNSAKKEDWTTTYPMGGGLPGQFYIHYHSYRWIWPLLSLAHYKKKFLDGME